MPLLSYAQNGEDIILHRALKEVEGGHYIDIGAYDPTEHSVTRTFYDRGWSGINVEASKPCFERIAAGRPRDRNLNVAVSARAGLLRFHEVSGSGLSTLDADAAANAERQGFSVETIDVPALSLADICRNLPFEHTHFLKIDVEGAEHDVLVGADFTAFRPWIVVVEATRPLTAVRVDRAWRDLLEAAGYDCTLFDGLNLYFLAREHGHLRDRLDVPANVLDDFVPVRLQRAEDAEAASQVRIADLDAAVRQRDATISDQAAELTSADRVAAERDAVIAAMMAERDAAVVAKAAEHEAAGAAAARRAPLKRRAVEFGAVETVQDDGADVDVDVSRVDDAPPGGRHAPRKEQATHWRKLDAARLEIRVNAERHAAELGRVQAQFAHSQAQLAHLHAQSVRLRQISDLTSSGQRFEDRGEKLLELRAGLVRQANAWQEEADDLRGRLGDALALAKMMYASTSWKVTSPIRGLKLAVRALLGRPAAPEVPAVLQALESSARSFDGGSSALVSMAACLDGDLALMADLLPVVSGALADDGLGTMGPHYAEARLEEQLTQWILDDVVRQRRAAL